ncbi:hypothetical protein F444_04349 [Phytophthora nicotianae P1976]|uniref:Uncharacterized protein n=1 Tax=Phytophthora nicotianae P1976 TaxID=1317066 RepID=A0A081AR14_PHYNI|nr:hypothetical protein F444_04349 [Phytophthora nicotianae P1976]
MLTAKLKRRGTDRRHAFPEGTVTITPTRGKLPCCGPAGVGHSATTHLGDRQATESQRGGYDCSAGGMPLPGPRKSSKPGWLVGEGGFIDACEIGSNMGNQLRQGSVLARYTHLPFRFRQCSLPCCFR